MENEVFMNSPKTHKIRAVANAEGATRDAPHAQAQNISGKLEVRKVRWT